MDIRKEKKVDSHLGEDGVWINWDEDTAVRVRSTDSVFAKAERERIFAPYRFVEMTSDLQARLTARFIACGLIADIKGVPSPTDPIQYGRDDETLKRIEDLMIEVPKFALEIVQVAASTEAFRVANTKAAVGN